MDETMTEPQQTVPFAPFEWMLSGRYLRARRREGFISVIAGFSFLGIMLGVATLIIVMAATLVLIAAFPWRSIWAISPVNQACSAGACAACSGTSTLRMMDSRWGPRHSWERIWKAPLKP